MASDPGIAMEGATSTCVPLEARAEWDAALDGVAHGFTHTWEHCHALYLTSGERTFLCCLEQEGVRIVCPFVERSWGEAIDIATPPGISGFTGTADAAWLPEAWQAFARARGYVTGYIGLNPLFARPSFAEGAKTYNSIYTFDLRRSPDELLARADENRRRQLRDYASSAARVVSDKTRLTHFLIEQYPGFVERVQATQAHRWSAETLRFLCTAKGALLIGTEGDHGIEAVYLFCFTDYAADAVLNVALPSGRAHTSLLVWFAVHHFKERGVPVLNLGGGAREDDDVARAKQRFGCDRLRLRALNQVYDPPKYLELCRRAGVDPFADGWFPAYRRHPEPLQSA
ncbi:MAG: hypothetical protein ACREF4_14885 [Gammaproteobacteria bacterium]